MSERTGSRRSAVAASLAIPPLSSATRVPRARLDALATTLTSVSVAAITAPGGYGKTTLMRAWYDSVAAPARSAWLTLTPHTSASELIEGISIACGRAFDGFGGSLQSLLRVPNLDARNCATAVVNELFVVTEDQSIDLVLFIDDLQFAVDDELVIAFLSGVLQALPPRVHIVLGSRRRLSFSPLAKLRNSGRLLAVDEEQLRFNIDEAQLLMDDRDAAAEVVDRTAGWAIAIHLTATLARMRGVPAATTFPSMGEAVFPFLAEEVVSTIEPELQQIMHELAVPSALDSETIGFVLERPDGAALLERLVERSLYLQRGDDGAWRFHHLFRDFLLKRLSTEQPSRYRDLCRRYAALLRQRGDNVNALEALIEAKDPIEIVEYVNAAIIAIRFTDRYRRLLDLLAQVPRETKERKPMLFRFHAIALQRAGRFDEAETQLRNCYDAALAVGDDGVAFHALLERGIGIGAFRFRVHGTYAASEECFRSALALAEGPSLRDKPAYAKLAYLVLGLARALRFEYREALEFLEKAERLEREGTTHFELLLVEMARVYSWMGDWRRALEYAERAEETFRTAAPYHVGYALLIEAKAMIALGFDDERCLAVCRETIAALRASYEDEELGAAWAVYADALLNAKMPDMAEIRVACANAERFLDPANTAVRCEVALLRARIGELTGESGASEQCLRAARRLTNGDRWLEARVGLESAYSAYERSEFASAGELFDASADTFESTLDRANETIARIGAAAARARHGTLDGQGARAVLEGLTTAGNVVNLPERCAAQVRVILYWCLCNVVEVRAATVLFKRVGLRDDAQLVALACDVAAPAEGRSAALRALVAAGSTQMRSLLITLSDDFEVRVATTAADSLAELAPESMSPLRIEAIGALRVHIGSDTLVERNSFRKKKAAELLRLLALAGAPITKSGVISALWPDASKGRDVTLRVTIHALRRALQPDLKALDDYVIYDGVTVSLRPGNVASVDAAVALKQIRSGKHLASLGDLNAAEAALSDAIDRLILAPKEHDAPAWLQPYLGRWRAEAMDGLRTLAAVFQRQGQRKRALVAVRRALELDPLDEPAVILALELFEKSRLFDEGHALYAAYKRDLAAVIGSAPGADVIERYSKLLMLHAERERVELSNREIQILQMVGQGRTSKEIAETLDLSVFTVNNHVGRILKKLGAESRAAAVARFHSIESAMP